MRPDLALEAARREAKVHWQLKDVPQQIIEGQKFDFGHAPWVGRNEFLFQKKWLDLVEDGYLPLPSSVGYAEFSSDGGKQSAICWSGDDIEILIHGFGWISKNSVIYSHSARIKRGHKTWQNGKALFDIFDPYEICSDKGKANLSVSSISFLLGVAISSAVGSRGCRVPGPAQRSMVRQAGPLPDAAFTYRMIEFGKARALTDRQLAAAMIRGVRSHHRRGHERFLKASGKTIMVSPCIVKGSRPGYAAHDYQLAAAPAP